MSKSKSSGVKSRHSLLDGVDLNKPVHEGYMYKQGHEHLAFNLRYFALYTKILVYYENEHDFKQDSSRGSLEHRHDAILLDGLYLSKPDKKPKGAKYCFILHAPDKKNKRHTVLLVTRTREERREWMEKLQVQNPHLLGVTSPVVAPDTPQPPRRQIRSDSYPGESAEKTESAGMTSLAPVREEGGRRGSFLDVSEMDIRDGASDVEDN